MKKASMEMTGRVFRVLTGKCPASPVLQDGVKGHNMMKLPCRKAPPFRAGSFTFVIILSLAIGMVSVTPSPAKTAKEINSEVNAALQLFTQKVKGGKEFLNTARGVLVIPNIIKAGAGVGGEYGEGALRIGGKTVDYYSLAGGSVGFQIGAQKTNLLLVFKQNEALENFRKSSGWKAGVDGSVAFIEVGAGKSLDTMNIKDPIVAFLFGQKGLMAKATIEGTKFSKLAR